MTVAENLSARLIHQPIHSPSLECDLESFGPGVQVGVTGPVNHATAWPGPAWRTTPDVDTNAHGDEVLCPYPRNFEWGVEADVKQAAAKRVGELTLGSRSAGESDPDSFRKFATDTGYPVLVVEYNSTPDTPPEVGTYDPAVPCSSSAAEPELISSDTPQLSARLTDDDDGSSLYAQFELYEGDALVCRATSRSRATVTSSSTSTLSTATTGVPGRRHPVSRSQCRLRRTTSE